MYYASEKECVAIVRNIKGYVTEMPWGFNCSGRCYGDSANGWHVNGSPSYSIGRAAMGSAEFFASLRCAKIFVTETAIFALEDDSSPV